MCCLETTASYEGRNASLFGCGCAALCLYECGVLRISGCNQRRCSPSQSRTIPDKPPNSRPSYGPGKNARARPRARDIFLSRRNFGAWPIAQQSDRKAWPQQRERRGLVNSSDLSCCLFDVDAAWALALGHQAAYRRNVGLTPGRKRRDHLIQGSKRDVRLDCEDGNTNQTVGVWSNDRSPTHDVPLTICHRTSCP